MTTLSKVIGAWYKTEELIFSMLGNDLAAETWEMIDKIQFEIKNKKGELIGVGPEAVRHRTSKALTPKAKEKGAVRETVVIVNVPQGMKDKYASEIEKKLKTKGFSFEIISAWREPQTNYITLDKAIKNPIDQLIEDTLSERRQPKKKMKASFLGSVTSE